MRDVTRHCEHKRRYNPAMPRAPSLPKNPAPNLLHWLAAVTFVLALAAAFWRAPQLPPGAFSEPSAPAVPTQAPLLRHGMLPGVGGLLGAPSLTRLADGRMAIAWLAQADAPRHHDVIWFSTLNDGNWSEPYPVVSSEDAAGKLFAHIRHLADPILFAHDGAVHLWFTAGGAGARRIVHTLSDDGGRHWQAPARLTTSPLGIADTGLRKAALPLVDGGLGLPLRPTSISARDEWLRLDADGRIVGKIRLPDDMPAAPWHPVSRPDTLADDRPQALIRLASGRLLLAGNTTAGTGTLAVWVGNADGSAWQAPRIIEAAADADFSAPSLALAVDAGIHLAYGWRQQGIRHLRFNEAWLDGAPQ